MATQYSNKPIVTDGLVYALDFGNQKSYVSGSTTANSLKYSPLTSSFLRAGNPGGVNVVNNMGEFTINGTTGSYVTLNMPSNPISYGGTFTICYIGKPKSGDSGYFYGAFDGGWPLFRFSSQEFDVGGYYTGRAYSGDDSLKYVTVLHSSGSYEYFVNGIPYAPTGFSGGSSSPSNPPHLSGRTTTTNHFTGSLGCFLVYNRKLTADEIWQNYQILAPKYGLSVPAKPYTLDPNAYLFLSQSGITDPIITGSINTFVLGLKSAGLWDKMVGIYPFVGTGSAGVNLTGSHRWNLKEPSTATYGITFTGSWNGSTSGSTPSGSNTNITIGQVTPRRLTTNAASSLIDQNNVHISILSYDTPVSSSYLMGTGMTEDLAVSTLAGDYGTPAAAYSVRKVRTAYSGALMDVRRDYDNVTSSIGYVSNGDLDTNSLLDWVSPGRSTLPGTYSGLAAAYSLRRVSSSYSGNAIDVRRSYDNTTGSVGFDSNGNLDTASLSTFVSRGDNFVLYSEQFDNAYWSKYDASVTPNTFIAPDGTLTADTVVFNNSSRELIKYSPTVPPTSSFSMFVSGTAGETIGIGSVVYSGGTVNQTYTLGTGWMRISASFSGSSDGIRLISTGTARTVYAWGAQLNSGSIPLPYVRTTTATKTNESGSFDTVSTGWVAQWYDQSGNGRHATQTATGSQPLIVSSGSLITENGKPALSFDGVNDSLTMAGLHGQTVLDQYFVTSTSDTFYSYPNQGAGAPHGYVAHSASTSTSLTSGYGSPTLYANGTLFTGTTRDDVYNFLNGSKLVIHQGASTGGWSSYRFSGYAAVEFTGKLQELIAYTSSQAANRPLIENNINNYYNIYTGSNHGFVARWYDQSGNNRHASQTATGSQPLIVLSGSVVFENGKPTVSFDGAADTLVSTTVPLKYIATVVNPKTAAGDYEIFVGYSNFNVLVRNVSGTSFYIASDTLFVPTTIYVNDTPSNTFSNSIMQLWTVGGNSPVSSNGSIQIGKSSRGSYASMNMSELIAYPDNQESTNRQPISYGINSYYNIYPQTSSFATSSFTIKADSGSISASLNNRLTSGIAASGPLGLITVSRTGSNSLTIARNGVTSSFAVPASGALSTGLYLGAINNNGIAVGNSPVNISFASVGTGLTGAEVLNLNTLVGTFNINLGRAKVIDAYAGALAAYSLRQLSVGYTGPAIEVRRSNDNASASIGFTPEGDLNITALQTFVGPNSAFVKTWYDQSGNNKHISQTNTSLQPQIVTAGSVITAKTFEVDANLGLNPNNNNTKPAVYFNNTYLDLGSTVGSITQVSYYLVFGLSAYVNGYSLFQTNTDIDNSGWRFGSGGGENGFINVFSPDGSTRRNFFPSNTPRGGTTLWSGFHGPGNAMTVYFQSSINKGTDTSLSFSSGSMLRVGRGNHRILNGTIQELIFYPDSSTTRKILVENQINTYYQIY